MNELTRIFLGGKLGQMFGKEWKLYVNSPAEALQAINTNTGGKLKEYLRSQKRDSFYKIAINKKYNLLTSEESKQPTGTRDIFIYPCAKGGNGVIRIIVGIILIIVGAVLTYFGYGQAGAFFIRLGIGLIIGGVVTLLIGSTGIPAGTNVEASGGSNIFANGAGVIAQGAPVRVVYGRALVTASDTPISVSYNNFDQSPNLGSNGSGGTGNSDNFTGGYYYPYTITDPTDGFPFYTQGTTPVPATPVSYS